MCALAWRASWTVSVLRPGDKPASQRVSLGRKEPVWVGRRVSGCLLFLDLSLNCTVRDPAEFSAFLTDELQLSPNTTRAIMGAQVRGQRSYMPVSAVRHIFHHSPSSHSPTPLSSSLSLITLPTPHSPPHSPSSHSPHHTLLLPLPHHTPHTTLPSSLSLITLPTSHSPPHSPSLHSPHHTPLLTFPTTHSPPHSLLITLALSPTSVAV